MSEFTYNPGNLKAAMKAAGATSRDLWYVPFGSLVIREGFNIRVKNDEHTAHIREIADSIKANGYYPEEPFGVFIDGDEIVVHKGHTRYEAVQLAISEGCPIGEVPCVPVPRGTTIQDLTVRLHTSNSGKPLSPYELALLCKRLIGFGWDEKKIADQLAFTKNYVIQLLSIIEAPADIRETVERGEISVGLANTIVQKHGKEAPAVVKNAVAKAKASGKTKATAKHVVDPGKDVPDNTKLLTATKRLSFPMYLVLEAVRGDAAFSKLDANIKQQILGILDQLDPLTK